MDAVAVVVAPRCFASLGSMNAPHYRTMGRIQARGHDLVTEDKDGNPVYHVSMLSVLMVNDATAGAGTQPSLADHPIFFTKFILDSGASAHATGNEYLFPWLVRVPQGGQVRAANGHQLAVRGFGPVIMENFRVNHVLYVPGLACNLISLSALIELDYDIAFTRAGCQIKDLRTGKLVGSGRLIRGLYHIDRLEIPLDRAPV